MSETWTNRKRRADINIIPLVDVLIILIFFFLLTMRYHDLSVLQIQLPKIDTAAAGSVDEMVRIAITSEGQIFLNEVPVSEEELARLLGDVASRETRQTILILSDEEGTVRQLTRVIDICRKNGLERFRILSR